VQKPFLINDGIGEFLERPRNIKERFDLKNWKFKKIKNEISLDSLFDKELNSSIIMRSLC